MTWTIWVTWVTFLVGQVGLIRKLNIWMWPEFLIDHIFFRKRHWHLINEWTLVWWMHFTITGVKPAYYTLSCFEVCGVQRFHSQKFIAWDQSCILKKSMEFLHIWFFSMSFYTTFKKKPLACGSKEGHMWVTSGLFCGSVDQQVWPTFNPDSYSYVVALYRYVDFC